MTKIGDFPYPIYDLTKNLIPYLWPDLKINTLFQNRLIIISLVQTNIKGNVYLLLLGRLQDCMCKKRIKDQGAKIDTLFMTTMAAKWL